MAWEDEDLDAVSILVPVDIIGTSGALVAVTSNGSALAEDSNPAWAAGTTYALGARVYSLSTHTVYESLQNSNVGRDPTIAANRTTAAGAGTWWIVVGPTNRTAMFDGLITTQTSAPSPLVITLSPGAFNGFALFGVDADSYSVQVLDAPGGNVVYSESTTALEGSMPSDYYEYFFDRFKPLTQIVRTGIDPYGSGQIILTLTKATGNVLLGMFAIGDMKPIGLPQRDVSIDPMDFSYFAQDAYGNATVKKRPNGTGLSITAVAEVAEANSILGSIKQVLGTPVVVVGSQADMYEWMTVFGLISASVTAPDFGYVQVKITVKAFI